MDFYLPVTLEELKNLTDEEVVQRINAKIVPKTDSAMQFSFPDFVSAQFYMAELDRRENRRADAERREADAKRDRIDKRRRWVDLGLEALIILLIGFELWMGWAEGHKQFTVLDNLEKSAEATSATLTALQATNDLNNATPRYSTESLPVSIDITYSPMERRLVITNLGKSGISLLGYQFDGRRGPKFNPPDYLRPGETFDSIPADDAMNHVSFEGGQPWYMPFHFSFKGIDGTEYYSTTILAFTTIKGSYHVSCGPTLVVEYPWTRRNPQK